MLTPSIEGVKWVPWPYGMAPPPTPTRVESAMSTELPQPSSLPEESTADLATDKQEEAPPTTVPHLVVLNEGLDVSSRDFDPSVLLIDHPSENDYSNKRAPENPVLRAYMNYLSIEKVDDGGQVDYRRRYLVDVCVDGIAHPSVFNVLACNADPSVVVQVRGILQPGIQFDSTITSESYAETRREFGLHISLLELPKYFDTILSAPKSNGDCENLTFYTLILDESVPRASVKSAGTATPRQLRFVENNKHRRLTILSLSASKQSPAEQARLYARECQLRTSFAGRLLHAYRNNQQRVAHLEAELRMVQSGLEQTSQELKRTRKRIEEDNDRYQEESSKQRRAYDKLVGELKLKDEELRNELQRLEILERLLNEEKSKFSDLLENRARLARDCEGLEATNEDFKFKIARLEEELKCLRSSEVETPAMAAIRRELAAAKSSLGEKDIRIRELTAELNATQAERDAACNANEVLKDKLKELQREFQSETTAQERVSKLLKDNEHLKGELKQTKMIIESLEHDLEREKAQLRSLNLHFARRLAAHTVSKQRSTMPPL